jgi:anti-sigma regulatory factor (Ser/Thr protein kinase)
MTMPDLAMHILDIVENSTRAGAKTVSLDIVEDSKENIVTILIIDDGKGMTEEESKRALDPFYTTKKERNKVGLGLPMLRETAEQAGGSLVVTSTPGKGTKVRARMVLDHIDRPPLGDINETLQIVITTNPGIIFDIAYTVDGETENFSTRDDSQGNGGVPHNAA